MSNQTALAASSTPRVAPDWVAIASELAVEFGHTALERDRTRRKPVAELQKIRESGLVNLLIPEKFGGGGGKLSDAFQVVFELSKTDASIGLIVGLHYWFSSFPRYFDLAGEGEHIERRSAANSWLWSNITAPTELLEATPRAGGGYILNGIRKYNTAVSLADVTAVLAQQRDSDDVIWAVVPTGREGLRYEDDWESFGVQTSDTSTAIFENVEVLPHEVVPLPQEDQRQGFPSFSGTHSSMLLQGVALGAAFGAFEAALDYARTKKRIRFTDAQPRLAPIAEDPLVQLGYGDLWIKLQAAKALLNDVGRDVDDAWERRLTISRTEIAEISSKRSWAYRAFASEVALEVATEIFEVNGLGSTSNRLGLDRYWRDIRSITLHDPLPAVRQAVGRAVLGGPLVDYGSIGTGLWRVTEPSVSTD